MPSLYPQTAPQAPATLGIPPAFCAGPDGPVHFTCVVSSSCYRTFDFSALDHIAVTDVSVLPAVS